MNESTPVQAEAPSRAQGTPEFVAIVAALMALTALSVDSMLPALPAMGASLGVADSNRLQLVLTFYLLGFALGQVVFGPLSDAFGRKPMLFVGLSVFAVASLGTVFAGNYAVLLAARMLQGFGCGAPRVIAIAVVRDLYGGRRMARIMSFVMMVFIIVPILAPSLGQVLMMMGHWRWIFAVLLAMALLLMLATQLRLPETRPREARRPISVRWLTDALRRTLSERQTVGYTLATGFVFGCLMAYLNMAQQVFVGIYRLGVLFPLAFGSIATALALAAWLNARLVQRVGMRRLSHAALIGFLATSAANLAIAMALGGPPPLVLFCLLLALNLFFFGFIMPNFNALAMQPQQAIAGTASSFVGFVTTGAGAVFGWLVGQRFDGTVLPLLAGFAGLTLAALAIVAVTEGGRLFAAGTSQDRTSD